MNEEPRRTIGEDSPQRPWDQGEASPIAVRQTAGVPKDDDGKRANAEDVLDEGRVELEGLVEGLGPEGELDFDQEGTVGSKNEIRTSVARAVSIPETNPRPIPARKAKTHERSSDFALIPNPLQCRTRQCRVVREGPARNPLRRLQILDRSDRQVGGGPGKCLLQCCGQRHGSPPGSAV